MASTDSPGDGAPGPGPHSPPDEPDALPLLRGAVVQRAEAGPQSAVLKVREPGRTTFVVARGGAGVGLSEAKPPKPEGGRSVAKLEGFRIVWVREGDVGLERGEDRARIDATRAGELAVAIGPAAWKDPVEAALADARAAFLGRGERLWADAAEADLAARRSAGLRAVKKGMARLGRRIDAVRGDLARMRDADALAQKAQWLIAEAARAPRGARALTVTDWSSGEPQAIVVPLDPAKPARVQVDAMFQRARRLKLGASVARERLAQAEAALAALGPVEAAIGRAATAGEIDAALTAARGAAPKDVKLEAAASREGPGERSRPQPKSPPFRTFHAVSGGRILVGRGAAQNDVLTFQIARPHDLWLHAKGYAGAHVVVPLAKNKSCPGDVLADAAHLAAHFSDARDEAVVDVQYAARRHLRKPRGSAAGLVVVDREKVIAVRIDARTLRALLESEEP